MTAYYNEIDPYASEWIKNLIVARLIADGAVDTRSIVDVEPDDLREFTQCHFFAGIGVWSYALRLAGWPDERGVWTGSCPCQPFSVAGRAGGFADERHLWPHWHHLIRERRPVAVLGEQVASKDGLAWLDLVLADLEGEGYAAAAVDSCSAGVGAPHIRQRLSFVAVADAAGERRAGERLLLRAEETGRIASEVLEAAGSRSVVRLDNNNNTGLEGQRLGHSAEEGREGSLRPVAEAGELGGVADDAEPGRISRRGDTESSDGRGPSRLESGRLRDAGRLADADGGHARAEGLQRSGQHGQQQENSRAGHDTRPSPTNGFWRAADWLLCRDGKWRPVEPGTFPLAHGAPARVGRLRAYGNAINAVAQAEFIKAAMSVMP